MTILKPGDRVNNYLLEEPVGSGSFGQVWRARHHVLDQTVAIKIPTDRAYVRELQREGVVIHGLRHPNIVRALDLDPYSEPPYLIMEYVEGPSLRQVIDAHPDGMPIRASVEIMLGMLQGLTVAHAGGLIHRDIKPANILLAHPADEIDSVTSDKVRVTDFGLGKIGGNTTVSIMQSGSLMTEDGKNIAGTIAYMSPEQKIGKDIDGRSDLYSCGIVLFEMLTGDRPQGTELPSDLRQGISKALDHVVAKSFTRLDRRFVSAEAMLDSLGGSADDPPPPPRTTSGARMTPPPPPVAPRRRSGNECPSCHEPTHPNDQFCIYCGCQLISHVPRCHACRSFVQQGDKFCIGCGADLGVKA